MTRKLILFFALLLCSQAAMSQRKKATKRQYATAQQRITQKEMRRIYEEVRTPYKFGMVVAPQSNDRKFDCPTVFRDCLLYTSPSPRDS